MTSGVNRLKELLFDTEAQRIADVQQRIDVLTQQGSERHDVLKSRIDAVFERAGTEERLQKSVASILDGALREAEVTKHEQLSRAVAPLVVKTIKYELKNSQDEMVDALYPITGRLVKQYMQTAMADLMADINRRLGGAKPSEIEKRAKDLGLTVPEYILAQTQALKVDELFLVRRGSGDLVAHWERPIPGAAAASQDGANRDVLIAGYLSGITAFSEEAFDDKKGSLRSLDMDGERIFVRASPAYLLAARCSGSAPQSVERIIDDEFVRVLGDFQKRGGEAPVGSLLPGLAASFEQRFDSERAALEERARQPGNKGGMGRLYAMAAVVLLPFLGWWAWSTWQSWQAARVLTEARGILAGRSDMRGFPIILDVANGGRALTVSGLAPDDMARTGYFDALRKALPETTVRDATGVLPPNTVIAAPRDPAPDIAALRADLDTLRQRSDAATTRLAELGGRVTPVPGQITALEGQLPDLRSRTTALDTEIRRLDQRINNLPRPAAPEPSRPTARDVLETYTRTHAIFFVNGADFVDDRRTADTLDRLAELIKADDSLVRVVGYTDERGAAGANASLALSRAERVAQMLIGRGVPRERLALVGRTAGQELSRVTGPGSPNRRVTFEIGYAGEPLP